MASLEVTMTFHGPDPAGLAEAVKVLDDHMRRTIRQPEFNIERGYMEYEIGERLAGGRSDAPLHVRHGGR